MPITTLEGIINGLQPPEEFVKLTNFIEFAGSWSSTFYSTGRPESGVASSAGLAGESLTSVLGQIPFRNPASGNTYLGRFEGCASQQGRIILADRLWQNSGIVVTTTTDQTINSVTWPARDRNGATNGDDVMVALEVTTLTGNGAPNTSITMSYTNQSGTSGRTANITSFNSSAQVGTFVPFELQAGDTGIRSIQTINLGTSLVSGAVSLVAYRVLANVDVWNPSWPEASDGFNLGFVRLFNNSVPFLLWQPSNTTQTHLSGRVSYSQG